MPDKNTPEPRYDCPVCPGLPMQKLKITQKDSGIFLTLDCCQRCGGVWFDKDEVKLSQQITSPKLRQRITQKPRQWKSHCRKCNALMERNLKNCDTCGWINQLNCPVCKKSLQRKQHKHLILDICHGCQGVWFDQAELLALWNESLNELSTPPKQPTTSSTQQHPYHQKDIATQAVEEAVLQGSLNSIGYGADMLAEPSVGMMIDAVGETAKGSVEALAQTPEVAGGTVEALAEVTGAALESVGELPEIVTVILEVTGEIAGGMTEVLAEVISGLFSG